MRDYRVRTAQKAKEHRTGRICDTPGCKGELKDTIINFGECLVERIYNKGFEIGAASDLTVCMGSSMRVPPACLMPMQCLAKPNGKLVMINLQHTPADPMCTLIINETCDKVMKIVCEKLGVVIPEFRRDYRLRVELSKDKKSLKLMGVDRNGACYLIFRNIKVHGVSARYASVPSGPNQS